MQGDDSLSARLQVDDHASEPSTHEQYNYSGDQICTIQTENTLFKIHRHMLTRDSAVFRDMFDLPSDPTAGDHETEVIRLPDSTKAFATLCWGLYALPTEVMNQYDLQADVDRLLELAYIAHKYQFASLETWSLRALETQCVIHQYTKRCSYERACALLSIAALTSCRSLQTVVETGILQRPDRSQVDLPWKDILPVFDQYGDRRFRGIVYYNLLQATEVAGYTLDRETGEPRLVLPLDEEHFDRIGRGYWMISKFWTSLALDIPEAAGCMNHEKCRARWKGFILGECTQTKDHQFIPQTQVIIRLSRAQELLNVHHIAHKRMPEVHPECRSLAAEQIKLMKTRMLDNMHLFFFGPVSASYG